MLGGMEIVVSESLAGSRRAVMVDGRLHVSPAMYSLISNATPEELLHILSNLSAIDLGHMPSIYDPMPMTTNPWGK